MLVLTAIDLKTFLVGLVGDAVPDFRSKHHLIAAHVVVHHILQDRLIGILVD